MLNKIVYRASDYPNKPSYAGSLQSGDSFIIIDPNPIRIGATYNNYPAYVSSIIYAQKKWWHFWERKKQVGYVVQWK